MTLAPRGELSARSRLRAFGSALGRRTAFDVAAASVAIASIATLDAQAPPDFDATALYLGVVTAIAWRALAAVAFLTAFAAWAAWITADLNADPANITAVLAWNGPAGLVIFVGVAALVRKVRLERDALRAAATHDLLTGLPNRVLLGDRLDQALISASREQVSVGVLAIDLDGFKKVNDTLGHHAGDQLLSLVAARIRKAIRTSDTCARVGGDEFVVLLPRTTSAGVTRVTESIGRACAEPFTIKGSAVTIAASIGAALSPDDGTRADVLLRVADGRMYEAKAARRVP